MLLIPHTIGFPLRLAVRGVVVLHVALAAAVLALVAVAGLPEAAADDAAPRLYRDNPVEDRALALKANGGIAVYPVSEGAHAVERADVQHPCFGAGLGVLACVYPVDAMSGAQRDQRINHGLVPGYGQNGPASRLYVNTAIAIEHAPDKVVSVPPRDINAVPQFSEAVGQFGGRNADGHHSIVAANGVLGANILSQPLYVVRVNGGQAEHEIAPRRMAVGAQEPEPIRLGFGVDRIEESFVYGVKSRS